MEKLRTSVILASVRPNRIGEKVATWFTGLARARAELDVTLVDLRDWPLGGYRYERPPKAMESAYPDALPRRWVELIAGFDGFVVVTPEYNHAYPGQLKDALDHAYTGWNNKPLAIVTYGGPSGGIRCAEALKLVAVELQLAPIREEVNLSFVHKAFGPDGAPTEPLHAQRAGRVLDQLTWWMKTLRDGRARYPLAG